MRLKEEITLVSNKPNIAELLWYTTEVRGLDLRPEENSVKAKGELFIFALYTGDDESGTLQWIEHSIPVSYTHLIKGDRYVRTVLLIFHFSGMEGIGIAEDNIALFQMEGAVVYTIMHGAFFYISNLDFRMAVPHKRIGIVFRQDVYKRQVLLPAC